MNLIEGLAEHLRLEESTFFPGAYIYRASTPAHQFTHLVLESNRVLHHLTARDSFDLGLAVSLLESLVEGRLDLAGALNRPIIVLEDRLATSRFDAVGFLGPAAHDSYRTYEGDLHSRTLVVFPMRRFEFGGWETAEEVRLMRRRFVATVNWERDPTPKISVMFNNVSTGAGSKGFVLVTREYLDHEVRDLKGSVGSVMEVRNFRREVAKITWDAGYDLCCGAGPEISGVDFPRVEKELATFLAGDFSDCDRAPPASDS